METIIGRGWFHMDRRLLKYPVILGLKGLDNKQLDNQRDPPLQTSTPIPSIISTYNLTIFSEIAPPPNLP